MSGGVVEDDDGGLGELLAKVVKKEDNVLGVEALGGRISVKISAVVAQKAGHIEARPARGRQGDGFARRLPGAGHVGDEAEAGFVVIIEVAVVGLGQVQQIAQLALGTGKGFGVALGLEGVADPLKTPLPPFLNAVGACLSNTRRHGRWPVRAAPR